MRQELSGPTSTRNRNAARVIGTMAVATLLGAGCGGDDAEPVDGTVEAEAALTQFDQDTYEATAGEVTFEYFNLDAIPHSLILEGPGAPSADEFRMLVVTQNEQVTGSVELEPGTYAIVCDITGHREQGMVAELIVS